MSYGSFIHASHLRHWSGWLLCRCRTTGGLLREKARENASLMLHASVLLCLMQKMRATSGTCRLFISHRSTHLSTALHRAFVLLNFFRNGRISKSFGSARVMACLTCFLQHIGCSGTSRATIMHADTKCTEYVLVARRSVPVTAAQFAYAP
jgi:hypothetical protein